MFAFWRFSRFFAGIKTLRIHSKLLNGNNKTVFPRCNMGCQGSEADPVAKNGAMTYTVLPLYFDKISIIYRH